MSKKHITSRLNEKLFAFVSIDNFIYYPDSLQYVNIRYVHLLQLIQQNQNNFISYHE